MRRTYLILAGALAFAGILVWLVLNRESPPVIPLTASPEARPEPGAPLTTAPVVAPSHPTPTPLQTFPAAWTQSTPAPKSYPAPTPAPPPPRAPSEPPGGYSREEISADVDQVKLMVQKYRSTLGENPTGNNAEIVKAMRGENPRHIRIDPDDSPGQRVNEKGELVDRWGTPYFFHALSSKEMEVRSAGPDHEMWTPDDVITK